MVALLLGCGGGGNGPGDSPADARQSEEGGPVVSAFTVTPTSISDSGTATFGVVVSDSDGDADILGGELRSGDGATLYAPIQRVAQGRWQVSLTWTELHAVVPIEFSTPTSREFRAVFWDSTDKTGFALASLSLTCGAGAACDGTCTDTTASDTDCGACGVACTVRDIYGGCDQGGCAPTLSDCITPTSSMTCAGFCASLGETCAACGTKTTFYYSGKDCEDFQTAVSLPDACDEPLDLALGTQARCCCTDTPE